jgi:hypothetical protein
MKARKRERVRRSPLVDRPFYQRLRNYAGLVALTQSA